MSVMDQVKQNYPLRSWVGFESGFWSGAPCCRERPRTPQGRNVCECDGCVIKSDCRGCGVRGDRAEALQETPGVIRLVTKVWLLDQRPLTTRDTSGSGDSLAS